MVKRIGTSRRKTRHKMKVPVRQQGKISIARILQTLNIGEKVVLKAQPALHNEGLYYRRFHGRTGTVTGKKGSCYEVAVSDFGKTKRLIISPAHLVKVQS